MIYLEWNHDWGPSCKLTPTPPCVPPRRLLPFNALLLDGCCCVGLFQHSPKSPSPRGAFSDEDDQVWLTSPERSPTSLSQSTNLHRTGSIQNLIHKFSGPDDVFTFGNGHYPTRPGRLTKAYSVEVLDSSPPTTPSSAKVPQSPIPIITVTPTLTVPEAAAAAGAEKSPKSNQIIDGIDCPVGAKQDTSKAKSKTQPSSKDFMVDSGMGSVSGDKPLATVCVDVIAWNGKWIISMNDEIPKTWDLYHPFKSFLFWLFYHKSPIA